MNFKKLFKLQKELDKRIVNEHNLDQDPTISEKILALEVELGTLANVTRCFKYWSSKIPSNKEIISKEYVDCLYFILSIGLESKFEDEGIKINSIDTKITEQFLNLYIDITDFIICSSRDHYITLFEDFLTLGLSLGFSEIDIETTYYEKNNINHEIQTSYY